MILVRKLFFTVLLTIFNFSALAQGSLEPSAPPGPTMKTLDQVEARIPVSAAGTLSASGSYYLTNNISGEITFGADNTQLDLNGFVIDGTTTIAVRVDNHSNIRIHNGTIINGTGSGAIIGYATGDLLVEDVQISDTAICANFIDATGVLEFVRVRCIGTKFEGFRIFVTDDIPLRAIIRDSLVRNTDGHGQGRPAIHIYNNFADISTVVISGNRVFENPNGGIRLDTTSGGTGDQKGSVTDNIISNIGGGGSALFVSGDFFVGRNIAQGNISNYNFTAAPNAAPIKAVNASPGAWDNISE